MGKTKPIELPGTISQAIYEYLKKAIIRGEYGPGRRLQEKEFAAMFNVSSTPVREAFFHFLRADRPADRRAEENRIAE
jgi:DNA-binding GntR family transcriptional regulator